MKKIIISGYYGFDNFGDEAVLEILIKALKELDVDITVLSKNPEITARLNEVNAFQTFNIVDIIHQVFVSDILISGGGSLLQDKTSKLSFLYYLFVIAVALGFNKRVLVYSQGFEPLNNKYMNRLLSWVLKKVDYISVRNTNSSQYLKQIGVASRPFADSAWTLYDPNVKKQDKIVLQLRETQDFSDEKMNILAKLVANKFESLKVEVLSLQKDYDLQVCENFAKKLENLDMDVSVLKKLSNIDVVKAIASAKFVVAMRYHACLIALNHKIPTVALGYDDKVKNLASEFEIPCVEMSNFKQGFVKNALEEIDNIVVDKALLEEKQNAAQSGINDIIRVVNNIEVFE